jgi:hypothetical protein
LRSPLVHEIVGLDYVECGKPFPEFLTRTVEITPPTLETERGLVERDDVVKEEVERDEREREAAERDIGSCELADIKSLEDLE